MNTIFRGIAKHPTTNKQQLTLDCYRLTRENVNHLEFNHIANSLVFQYSKLSDEN